MRSKQENAYELKQKLVNVTRTAKVVKGGRVFGFLALVVVGDGAGKFGYGLGKGKEVPVAIQKAVTEAKKRMVHIQLNGTSIYHDIKGRHGASRIIMMPASEGTGVIAGGAMRAVCEVLGIEDILAKSMGSSNAHNVVRATANALNSMQDPLKVAQRRGIPLEKVLAHYDNKIKESTVNE
jgi:small subunit ribosomal protein S5